jgi:transcriptional regulator with XRE-family HTH domain
MMTVSETWDHPMAPVNQHNPSRLAKLLEVLCAARPDLAHDDGSPNASAIARAGIKRGHNISQPTVSRILHGQIISPSTPVIRALADVFGVAEMQIRGEDQSEHELTPLQRSIAERWAQLPKPVQDYLAMQIDQVLEFTENSPAAAKAIYKEGRKSHK